MGKYSCRLQPALVSSVYCEDQYFRAPSEILLGWFPTNHSGDRHRIPGKYWPVSSSFGSEFGVCPQITFPVDNQRKQGGHFPLNINRSHQQCRRTSRKSFRGRWI